MWNGGKKRLLRMRFPALVELTQLWLGLLSIKLTLASTASQCQPPSAVERARSVCRHGVVPSNLAALCWPGICTHRTIFLSWEPLQAAHLNLTVLVLTPAPPSQCKPGVLPARLSGSHKPLPLVLILCILPQKSRATGFWTLQFSCLLVPTVTLMTRVPS